MKYKYTYLLDDEVVDRDSFVNALNMVCLKTDYDYEYPLRSISFTNEKEVKREIGTMRKYGARYCLFRGGHKFKMIKEDA